MATLLHVPDPLATDRAERWALDAGPADLATLDIAPHAQRDRVFEIDVRFELRAPEDCEGAWQSLAVELNGRAQWQRRAATANPGQTDSLDYHCRVQVPVGEALRVRALTQVARARRLRLVIEAEESR